ncbi:hypothetical protein BGZ65_006517 [Modicella reniformis]|uniref:Uncharacterized protein n=1 Tax=Modicella reniformis TaxID=1440133 RepID=A0A9P6MB57_9FUNG|nr:hypothetical protein BGZ65_006517 [Modicella reniformis]
MEYMSWPLLDDEDGKFGWTPTVIFRDLKSSDNALTLITRNPGLQKLDVLYQDDRIRLNTFTKDVLAALSSHQSLRPLVSFESLLISVLEWSPLLEHLKLGRVGETAFEDGIVLVLIRHCPHLMSFHQKRQHDWNGIQMAYDPSF